MILDACCGAQKMYHGHQYVLDDQDFITIDIRSGDFSYQMKNSVAKSPVIVEPKVLADMQHLPFKDNVFDIIVCDPPHMDCGLTGFMSKAWGSWNQKDANIIMKMANIEFSRCLKNNGTLILKVMGDLFSRYQKMLSNFIFFLPIQTIRPNGCMDSKESKKAALWFVAIKMRLDHDTP